MSDRLYICGVDVAPDRALRTLAHHRSGGNQKWQVALLSSAAVGENDPKATQAVLALESGESRAKARAPAPPMVPAAP
jgi:hypothetical protein